MPRRKHKAEYKRHVARGPARASTRPQARKHATARKSPIKEILPIDDPRFETAIREMNRERSLTAAARRSHISFRRLRRVLAQHRLIKRKGRRWIAKDLRSLAGGACRIREGLQQGPRRDIAQACAGDRQSRRGERGRYHRAEE